MQPITRWGGGSCYRLQRRIWTCAQPLQWLCGLFGLQRHIPGKNGFLPAVPSSARAVKQQEQIAPELPGNFGSVSQVLERSEGAAVQLPEVDKSRNMIELQLRMQVQGLEGNVSALRHRLREADVASSNQEDLLPRVARLLQENRFELAARHQRQAAEMEFEAARKREELLRTHKELGFALTAEQFGILRGLWKGLLDTDSDSRPKYSRAGLGDKADVEKSGCYWEPTMLSRYVRGFTVMRWDDMGISGSDSQRWPMEDLEHFLLETSASPEERGIAADSQHPCCAAILERLNIVLDGLAVGHLLADSKSGDAILSRLRALSDVAALEVVCRVVVDTLLLTLCAHLGMSASLEETVTSNQNVALPRNRCDYVLRARRSSMSSGCTTLPSSYVVGSVEVKRCDKKWQAMLAQGVSQCFWQLLALRAMEEELVVSPLLGIVSDGRRWVCLELHERYLMITPILDLAAGEAHLQLLLRFLTDSFSKSA